MKSARLCPGLVVLAILAIVAPRLGVSAEVKESNYRGWKTYELTNGLASVQVAPEVGRIIQYKLGDFEFLWVNDQLAGKTSPPTGVGPKDEWLNYGGDKLWPAPQGWSGPNEWPGPPGPVPNAEGLPNKARVLGKSSSSEVAFELTSPDDKYTGLRFSRKIALRDSRSRVSLLSRIENVSDKPRRWGIWQVTQLSCVNRKGAGHDRDVWAYCPINPKSIYKNGYKVLFGAADNPAFRPDLERGMMRVHYERQVGKVGMDNMAGWLAVVWGGDGHVFVERFVYSLDEPHPDGASVEFWLQAPGKFSAGGKDYTVADNDTDAPPYMEAEVLSPFAELKPGDTYSFRNEWYATSIGGNYPIRACNDGGVVSDEFVARIQDGRLVLAGRFGVFSAGKARLVFLDGNGKEIAASDPKQAVSPDAPLVLSPDSELTAGVKLPKDAAKVLLTVTDNGGRTLGVLATAAIQR